MGDGAGSGGESHQERVNRELIELLNELRVTLPGVQVLFAFLLTVPISQGFERFGDLELTIYFATFVATTIAAALLMAPTSYHRLRFREGDKEQMLHTVNRFAIAGTASLALAMSLAGLLVANLLYGLTFATVFAACVLAVLAWCWFGLPLSRKIRDGRAPAGRA